MFIPVIFPCQVLCSPKFESKEYVVSLLSREKSIVNVFSVTKSQPDPPRRPEVKCGKLRLRQTVSSVTKSQQTSPGRVVQKISNPAFLPCSFGARCIRGLLRPSPSPRTRTSPRTIGVLAIEEPTPFVDHLTVALSILDCCIISRQ